MQCYKRCEDIFLDKYHVILPELQWHKTAHVLRLHSQALLKSKQQSSSSCQPGHTVWRRQGGQLHHQEMKRAEQARAEHQFGERAREGKGREFNGKKGKMTEKNWGKKKDREAQHQKEVKRKRKNVFCFIFLNYLLPYKLQHTPSVHPKPASFAP